MSINKFKVKQTNNHEEVPAGEGSSLTQGIYLRAASPTVAVDISLADYKAYREYNAPTDMPGTLVVSRELFDHHEDQNGVITDVPVIADNLAVGSIAANTAALLTAENHLAGTEVVSDPAYAGKEGVLAAQQQIEELTMERSLHRWFSEKGQGFFDANKGSLTSINVDAEFPDVFDERDNTGIYHDVNVWKKLAEVRQLAEAGYSFKNPLAKSAIDLLDGVADASEVGDVHADPATGKLYLRVVAGGAGADKWIDFNEKIESASQDSALQVEIQAYQSALDASLAAMGAATTSRDTDLNTAIVAMDTKIQQATAEVMARISSDRMEKVQSITAEDVTAGEATVTIDSHGVGMHIEGATVRVFVNGILQDPSFPTNKTPNPNGSIDLTLDTADLEAGDEIIADGRRGKLMPNGSGRLVTSIGNSYVHADTVLDLSLFEN